ncbi:TPA: Ig-like domain-containing protein [Enterobacter asburiae]|uniref:Ig-like domain-containing protein n=1 Tax=Enterobacter asburiae TaxID=61645 RepID=UPI0018D62EF2|nr:Ig-like domain-containing protein [Enterobacter asburiae]QPS66554.1 Ig-like domain-containing protein [Enterobacter asburiae]
MKSSNAPTISRPKVIVGWLTIITQAALPLSFAYTPLVQAAAKEDETKWYQSGKNTPSIFEDNASSLAAAGSALSQRDSGGAAEGLARSAATGALNNSVEEWLSQFGTARVQLNLDDKFNTNGGEADLLVPLYDNKSTVFFTQLGFRHQDDRNTGNVGLGARHFAGDWMLGVNTFYDNDFTGDNRRFGLGAEAWRDYLKLSANGYFRLSDWHQSRDFADYDERPANGYDLRAEGWLPAYPQLGAKLMYEQYQGDEVALFGKDNRQKDPWAFTGGITYTPVPLFTLGAQHRAGKDGQNDSQLSLQLNYRLGESWNKQLDPDLVGASRTLAGTRYDLVERNNNIVLDYRKQETVTLKLPEKTVGKSRGTVALTFSVKTKNTLQRIDWDAPALLAAGGSIIQSGDNRLNVTLPAYQVSGSNTYRIAGVAYDAKGNSGSATADIQVDVGDVSVGSSSMTASPTTLPADGKSTSTININIVDADGNPVPGMAKSLSASVKETQAVVTYAANLPAKEATLSAVEETSPGVYQAIVTAGTRAGTVTVSSSFNDTALPEITISQQADNSTGRITSDAIIVTSDNSVANNTAINTVTATITDAAGNKLANVPVTFSLSGSATVAAGSALNTVTDEKGVVSVAFINKVAETVKVTATLANGNSGTVDSHFVADSTTAAISSAGDITVDKTTVIANGSDAATFSAIVKDANGNPVPNVAVTWGSDKGVLSGTSSTTGANGVATITLKHTVAESAQVTVQVGTSGAVNAPAVNFSADTGSATLDSGSLSVDKTTLVANNVEFATYTATVKDANGNPVPNLPVEWKTDLGTLSGSIIQTDSNGSASVTLKGTKAGTAQVTASLNGAAPVNASSVTFTADSTSAGIGSGDVSVDKTILIANGSDIATFRAVVKDANGNPVSGATVNWATDKGILSAGSSVSGTDGVATITLHDTVTGNAQVTAQTGSSGNISAPQVEFIPDNASANIGSGDVTVDKTTVVANNSDVATFSAQVKDGQGNPVPNFVVNWNTTKGTLSGSTTMTNASGIATVTLKDTVAGAATVTAQSGTSSAISAPAVDFTPDSTTAAIGSGDLTVDKTSIVANNTDLATYTSVVKDAYGNPVQGVTVTWATDLGVMSSSTSVTDSSGQATATLKGTQAGIAQVTASVNGSTPVNAASVTLTADSTSAAVASGDISVDKTTLVANATDTATYSAVIKDANGNVVPGVTVNWATDKGTLSGSTSVTGTDGVAKINLSSTVAGDAQVAVKIGSSASVNAPVVNFTADSASAGINSSDLTVDKTTLVANNTEFATYTAIVKDAGGNLVPGVSVSWATSNGTLSGANSTTGTDGKATITLKSTVAGNAQVTATVNGTPVNASNVTFTADTATAAIGSGDLTVDKTNVVANDIDIATYTALVKDANGNAVPNIAISWATNLGTLSGATSNTGDDGKATITLKGTKAGDATVNATVNGASQPAAAVTLIADVTTATVTNLTASLSKMTGTGTESSVLTVTVKDAHGNAIPAGQPVSWSTTLGTLVDTTTQTDINGQSSTTLSGTTASGNTNAIATVEAQALAGSLTTDITILPVYMVGGKTYWTLNKDHKTLDEAKAEANCATYGGGTVASQADLKEFASNGGDFAVKNVPGEYFNTWYNLSGSWMTTSGKFHSFNSGGSTIPVGGTTSGPGSDYVCVK